MTKQYTYERRVSFECTISAIYSNLFGNWRYGRDYHVISTMVDLTLKIKTFCTTSADIGMDVKSCILPRDGKRF